MSERDRTRWDDRYLNRPPDSQPAPPQAFARYESLFPCAGTALDVACGQGQGSVWLARRGLNVWGLDISAVAIGQARTLAERRGVAERCRFDIADLDDGLPPGPPVDVIVCHRFRDRTLYGALIERLLPGGLLAISALSEVGAAPGPFRAVPGELTAAFTGLDHLAAGECDGEAWLLARAG